MSLTLYSHPFSSYCQKVLIALWENDIPFTYRHLEEPGVADERAALWPMGKFPVLVDGGRTVVESSIIIEHLDLHHRGATRWLPDDPDAALEVRFMDRFFDNYVMTPQGKLVFDSMREPDKRDPQGVVEARAALDTAYAWLDHTMRDREWAAGAAFTMADCAAAPALFYADWSYPIPKQYGNLHAYRRHLLARPSYARAVNEARPYRHLFPTGAPDRD